VEEFETLSESAELNLEPNELKLRIVPASARNAPLVLPCTVRPTVVAFCRRLRSVRAHRATRYPRTARLMTVTMAAAMMPIMAVAEPAPPTVAATVSTPVRAAKAPDRQ